MERLRLANDGTCRTPASCQRTLSRRNTNAKAHTKAFSSDFDPRHLLAIKIRNSRLRKRNYLTHAPLVDPATAAWFASLPPAIQRKHFDREERLRFAVESRKILLDSADETLYRRQQQQTLLSLHQNYSSSSVSTKVDENFIDHLDTSGPPEFYDDNEQSEIASNSDMEQYSVDSFRWLEDEEEIDLSLDDYHEAIAETQRRQDALRLSRLYRHTFSLSTNSVRRASTASSQQQYILSSPVRAPRAPSQQYILSSPVRAARASSISSHRHQQSRTSISSIDPYAAHYQDPAARMKLRLYLASPQKFDEAIEFGFPSMQEKYEHNNTRPKTSPRVIHDSPKTFFSDDTPSLEGDDGDSREDLDTVYDPRTPEESVFQPHRLGRKYSLTGPIRSVSRGIVEPSYAQGVSSDREMTLHMTLTRPDLRQADEPRPSNVNVNTVPLQHAELTFTEDPATFWDSLPPPEESKVKKFFKKLRMK